MENVVGRSKMDKTKSKLCKFGLFFVFDVNCVLHRRSPITIRYKLTFKKSSIRQQFIQKTGGKHRHLFRNKKKHL